MNFNLKENVDYFKELSARVAEMQLEAQVSHCAATRPRYNRVESLLTLAIALALTPSP